jgi:transcriptional regulator with XRE-family HTH domain
MLIQKLRLQHGWSQEQLAELSGVSVRTIQRLEGGQTGSLESLKALAAVFDIDFARLKEPDMELPPDLATPKDGLPPEEALALAHVRNIKCFYRRLAWFVLIIAALVAINVFLTPGYPWVAWVALGWGVIVALHWVKAFGLNPFLGADWERRQVEKMLGRRL